MELFVFENWLPGDEYTEESIRFLGWGTFFKQIDSSVMNTPGSQLDSLGETIFSNINHMSLGS